MSLADSPSALAATPAATPAPMAAHPADAHPAPPAASHPPAAPHPAPHIIEFDPRRRFINREMSWLAFNRRVFEEAACPQTPLLERLYFLAITANNLDEFFMKRVGGLQRQLAAGVKQLSLDGRTPQDQLAEIRATILETIADQSHLLLDVLYPRLREEGIVVASWDDLSAPHRNWLGEHFERQILPILTPLGVGPGQPFPFISNLSLSLAVLVRAPGESSARFARVKVPVNRPRWVQIPGEKIFIALEEVIAQFIGRLFVGMEILESAPFRVTRNADLERNEEEADDLLEVIEEELRNRKFAPIVRLETSKSISDELLERLVHDLEVSPERDVYQTDAPLGLDDLTQLYSQIDRPDLKNPPFSPVSHPRLRGLEGHERDTDIFAILRQGDLLVHHPFQSFGTSVLEMLQTAARDPQVLAIKQTLYRTATHSPIVMALLAAAENGKEVNVQVEIKARFDEANNIEWVRTLERAGVHVTYGFIGLKTHCKTMLIVREEPDGIRRYVHIGTGNYHTGTARLYTDLGLFTADPEICQDVADLFNYLTGHSNFRGYRQILVAPVNARARFLELIRREAEFAAAGRPAQIIAKMNQLEDPEIINALYSASQAGVKIDLIIRGFCCLRPGVPGLSDNIRVISIIGRFLEHSRIYRFANGGEPLYFLGSGDWMSRNLDWRVEAVVPIKAEPLQKEIDFILRTCWNDQRQAWVLLSDGRYERRRPRRGKGSQQIFIDRYARQPARG